MRCLVFRYTPWCFAAKAAAPHQEVSHIPLLLHSALLPRLQLPTKSYLIFYCTPWCFTAKAAAPHQEVFHVLLCSLVLRCQGYSAPPRRCLPAAKKAEWYRLEKRRYSAPPRRCLPAAPAGASTDYRGSIYGGGEAIISACYHNGRARCGGHLRVRVQSCCGRYPYR